MSQILTKNWPKISQKGQIVLSIFVVVFFFAWFGPSLDPLPWKKVKKKRKIFKQINNWQKSAYEKLS